MRKREREQRELEAARKRNARRLALAARKKTAEAAALREKLRYENEGGACVDALPYLILKTAEVRTLLTAGECTIRRGSWRSVGRPLHWCRYGTPGAVRRVYEACAVQRGTRNVVYANDPLYPTLDPQTWQKHEALHMPQFAVRLVVLVVSTAPVAPFPEWLLTLQLQRNMRS